MKENRLEFAVSGTEIIKLTHEELTHILSALEAFSPHQDEEKKLKYLEHVFHEPYSLSNTITAVIDFGCSKRLLDVFEFVNTSTNTWFSSLLQLVNTNIKLPAWLYTLLDHQVPEPVVDRIFANSENITNLISEAGSIYPIAQLCRVGQKYGVIDKVLTKDVLTTIMLTYSWTDHDAAMALLAIDGHSNNSVGLYKMLFSMTELQVELPKYLSASVTPIITTIAHTISKYPEVTESLPRACIKYTDDMQLLKLWLTQLVNNDNSTHILRDFCDLSMRTHIEVIEEIALFRDIPNKCRKEICDLLQGNPNVHYITMPKMTHSSVMNLDCSDVIKKAVSNIYTNLPHQEVAFVVAKYMTKLSQNPLIISLIEVLGSSHSQIYIGSGDRIPGTDDTVRGQQYGTIAVIKDGDRLLSDTGEVSIPIFATTIHEAMHVWCEFWWGNDSRPYSKQITREEDQGFYELVSQIINTQEIQYALEGYCSKTFALELPAFFIEAYVALYLSTDRNGHWRFCEFLPEYRMCHEQQLDSELAMYPDNAQEIKESRMTDNIYTLMQSLAIYCDDNYLQDAAAAAYYSELLGVD